jgi:exodeoxyribonuclease VII large subunit
LKKQKLRHLEQQLVTVNPEAVLNRGYSITLFNGKAVKDAAVLTSGDDVDIVLAKGKLQSTVNKIQK